jgi:hypothetical protein
LKGSLVNGLQFRQWGGDRGGRPMKPGNGTGLAEDERGELPLEKCRH